MSVEKKEPKKAASILEENLQLELKPADVSPYLLRGFEVLADIAESQQTSLHDRFHAIAGLGGLYSLIAGKEFADESLDKLSRAQNRTLDEVKRLRKKPWDDEDVANGEE